MLATLVIIAKSLLVILLILLICTMTFFLFYVMFDLFREEQKMRIKRREMNFDEFLIQYKDISEKLITNVSNKMKDN